MVYTRVYGEKMYHEVKKYMLFSIVTSHMLQKEQLTHRKVFHKVTLSCVQTYGHRIKNYASGSDVSRLVFNNKLRSDMAFMRSIYIIYN